MNPIYINYINLRERFIKSFPKLSLITVKNYVCQLKKVKGYDLQKPRDIEKGLFNKYKIANYKQMIISIIKYLRFDENNNIDLIDEYSEYMDDLTEIIYENNDINEKSNKEKELWTTFDNLKKVFYDLENVMYDKKLFDKTYDRLTETNKIITIDYLLIALFTLTPPRRARDYSEMIITNKENNKNKNINYLVIINNEPLYFLFNNYKTSKTYGEQKININNHLKSVIKKYLKIKNYDDDGINKRLFTINKNKILTANNLSKKIKSIFLKSFLKKPININLIRHIFISEKVGEEEIELLKYRKHIAYAMGHSADMQIQYIKR